jgi:imidazole glycerol-phosphate synthase subunit HisH
MENYIFSNTEELNLQVSNVPSPVGEGGRRPDGAGVVVIRYNAGNIQSVLFALERLSVQATVTDDIASIQAADKIIFPGVGAANSAMPYLKERGLDDVIRSLKQPFLGICLGMQLMCVHSEEGDTECLGIFNLPVRKFTLGKVPHVGWNLLQPKPSVILQDLEEKPYCYFVHSYYAALGKDTAATTEYGMEFSSVLQKDNFYGVQFHPEKSAKTGEQILKNFLEL